MKPISHKLSSALAALMLAGAAASFNAETAMAQSMTSYEQQKIDPYIGHAALKDRPDLWDGSAWKAGADYQDVTTYLSNYLTTLNKGLGTWPGLTNAAKRSDEGRAFADYMNGRQALGATMQAAYPAFKEAKLAEAARLAEAEAAAAEAARETAMAEADAAETVTVATLPDVGDDNLAACQAFKREVMNRNQGKMQTLRAVLGGQPLNIGGPEQVQEWRDFASTVKTACAAAGPEVTRRKCKNAYRDEDQPATWCADIARADEVIRAMVMSEVKTRIQTVTRSGIQSVESFQEQEGWLEVLGAETFDTIFDPASILKPYAREQIGLLLAEIDLTLDDISGELQESSGRLNELRNAVMETAGRWESPFRAGENYSTGLATSMLTKAYGGGANVQMKDVWLSRTEWKIHKNALGIPDRRTLPGYALVRVNADPEGLCQLRSFTLTEQFDGTGYQKAGALRFGYTRFQTCP